MGLDVGVIPSPIKYLGRPENDVYDFVWHLQWHADDEETWSVSSDMNTIVEFSRETMALLLEEYVNGKELTQQTIDKVRGWIDALPWHDDHIMLHFNW